MKRNYLLCLFLLITLFTFIFQERIIAQRYWNTAAKFEGNKDSYIAIYPNSTSKIQNLFGSFSVECWFNFDGFSGNEKVATLFGNDHFRLMLQKDDSTHFRGRMQTNGITRLYTTTQMLTNRWYHLACTYNKISGDLNFYIDKNQRGTANGTGWGPSASQDTVFIGTSKDYSSF